METMRSESQAVSLELYYKLLRIRMIEEEIANRYSEQKMRCPVHLSIGQEAIAVGVCHHLLPSDYLIGNHRAHAHYLAKGGSLKNMLAEIYGKVDGCSRGRGGSMHLIDKSVGIIGTTPIVGGSIPVGVGVAFASQLKKEKRITTILFGEGSTEEGVWAESLNFAALRKLSILFVCENNFYSCYSPMNVRQPEERSRIAIAEAHGIKGFQGYGNDVEEVSKLAKQVIDYLREERGPALLELDTYRYREHCGPFNDDSAGYRPAEEVEKWNARCPLDLHTKYLKENNLLSHNRIDEMRKLIECEINEAFEFAQKSPFPTFNLSEKAMYA